MTACASPFLDYDTHSVPGAWGWKLPDGRGLPSEAPKAGPGADHKETSRRGRASRESGCSRQGEWGAGRLSGQQGPASGQAGGATLTCRRKPLSSGPVSARPRSRREGRGGPGRDRSRLAGGCPVRALGARARGRQPGSRWSGRLSTLSPPASPLPTEATAQWELGAWVHPLSRLISEPVSGERWPVVQVLLCRYTRSQVRRQSTAGQKVSDSRPTALGTTGSRTEVPWEEDFPAQSVGRWLNAGGARPAHVEFQRPLPARPPGVCRPRAPSLRHHTARWLNRSRTAAEVLRAPARALPPALPPRPHRHRLQAQALSQQCCHR